MSYEYNKYLKDHRKGVLDAANWLLDNLPDTFDRTDEWVVSAMHNITFGHDFSKDSEEEYNAYDNWFYGPKSYGNKVAFNKAWLHHIHNNPHHWQHWVLHNDDEEEGTVCLEMSREALFEMIADWLSFGIISGNPGTILDFYEKQKDYILLHDATRKQLEKVLELISEKVKKDSGPLL